MESSSTTRSSEMSSHPWDGYLSGPENELAMAAAQALVRGSREGVSPLIVYGPSGVGKSRLLLGLVTEWLSRYPGSSVAHLDAAAFITACLRLLPLRAVLAGVCFEAVFGLLTSLCLKMLTGWNEAPSPGMSWHIRLMRWTPQVPPSRSRRVQLLALGHAKPGRAG